MIKQIYLVRGEKNESYEDFKDRIQGVLIKLSKQKEIVKLSFTLTEEAPPSVSIIPFKKHKIASITIFKSDDRLENSIRELQGFKGAYSVTEALPVEYVKDWEDGIVTPGVCLLTLFRQKKNIDYTTFLNRWHNNHTPLSLKIHPLWHYSRNVVESEISEDVEPWQGIVEEHTRTRSELLNPFKFFGPPHLIIQRMLQVYTDTKSFIDYSTIETYLVAEYHLKS